MRDLAGRDAEHRDLAAVRHVRRASSRSAPGLPDISRPTSKPSFIPSSRPTATIVLLHRVDRARHAEPARDARAGTRSTSVITTWRAPAWRTTAAAMMPIGPGAGDQDVLADDLERERGVDGVAERVEDRGHVRLDAVLVDARRWRPAARRTRRTRRRRPPRARACRAHRWRRPAMQLRQRPQTRWPSPLTSSPVAMPSTLVPISTTSPTNSWPTTSGVGTVCCAQASHASMCRSVPQMPARLTRTSTSSGPTSGSGTDVRVRPGSGRAFTSARIGRGP